MIDFAYEAPKTVADAIAALKRANGSAKLLAGGTDILVQLREGLRSASVVVDVKKIPELVALVYDAAKGLTFGAATPCYRIYGDPQVSKAYAGLCDATRILGAWQIQSRASVGGNLCNSSPAADTIPALIAYDAKLHIAGPAGTRSLAVADFCTGPGKNVLAADELLTTIELPAQPAKSGGCYQRFIPRNEMDIAVVGVGSWVRLNDAGDAIVAARIGLGAVGPTPMFAADASDWLAGKPATAASFAQAGELAKKIARPISDMRGPAEHRLHLVGVLTARTLARAADRARGIAVADDHP